MVLVDLMVGCSAVAQPGRNGAAMKTELKLKLDSLTLAADSELEACGALNEAYTELKRAQRGTMQRAVACALAEIAERRHAEARAEFRRVEREYWDAYRA